MATTYKITTGTGSATYRVSTGARGPQGLPGSDASVTESNVLAAVGDGSRIGAEFIPNALSGVNNPSAVVISGVATAGINGTLIPAGTYNGKPAWSTDGTLTFGAGNTILRYVIAGWELSRATVYFASKITPSNLPFGLTDWVVIGSGSPTVEAMATPSHIGQLYRDTTANVWYRATSIAPPVWQATEIYAPDIGEALADDDRITVFDASKAIAKTSALSRVWTWLMSKLAATPLPLTHGGTGAQNASAARTALGAGAAGDAIFQAATYTAANTALKIGVAYCSSNATRNTTATLEVDPTMILELEAASVYEISAWVEMSFAGAVPGAKFRLLFSAALDGTNGNNTGVIISNGGYGAPTTYNISSASGAGDTIIRTGTSTNYVWKITVTVRTLGACNVSMQWAQNTSDAANITRHAGSYLKAVKIAP